MDALVGNYFLEYLSKVLIVQKWWAISDVENDILVWKSFSNTDKQMFCVTIANQSNVNVAL